MFGSLGTELCCLLGPDGGTGIFGGTAPFCGRVGSIAFPRVAMMPLINKEEKAVFRGYITLPITGKKRNWAVGIKVRDRDSILLQKRNRRGWLQESVPVRVLYKLESECPIVLCIEWDQLGTCQARKIGCQLLRSLHRALRNSIH